MNLNYNPWKIKFSSSSLHTHARTHTNARTHAPPRNRKCHDHGQRNLITSQAGPQGLNRPSLHGMSLVPEKRVWGQYRWLGRKGKFKKERKKRNVLIIQVGEAALFRYTPRLIEGAVASGFIADGSELLPESMHGTPTWGQVSRYIWRERQTDRQTDRQRQRQTDRDTETETDRERTRTRKLYFPRIVVYFHLDLSNN